jgi:methionyl-tRNA synthetase
MPESCEKIFAQLGVSEELAAWDTAAQFGIRPNAATVTKGDALFPRIDPAKELAALEQQA